MSPAADDLESALRSDLAFISLDDEEILFSQEAQSLVGLNPTAAFVVRGLLDGGRASDVALKLASQAGVSPDQARDWVTALYQTLTAHGLLKGGAGYRPPQSESAQIAGLLAARRAKVPPLEPFEPMVEGRYRLLGTRALVRYQRRLQKRMVDSVIGHLKTDEAFEPNLVIDIAGQAWGNDQLRNYIYCNGAPEARTNRLSGLGPLVKSALWVHAVNGHDFMLHLHAGVVGRNGRCILLPAAPGSGKSSLTMALTHSGWGYYSDEVALVERATFQLQPVPLAVCVKDTGWGVMSRYCPDLESLPVHKRDDGKVVRYVPPPPDAVQRSPASVSHIFFPRYSSNEPTRLEPVARAAALARLMEQCLALRQRLDPDNVRELIRWIGGIECHALTFSSLDQAVALVEKAVSNNIL